MHQRIMLSVFFLITTAVITQVAASLPATTWPSTYQVEADVSKEGSKKYRLVNYHGTSESKAYEAILNKKFDDHNIIEIGKFIKGSDDWLLNVARGVCSYNDTWSGLLSYKELFNKVVGKDASLWIPLKDSTDCFSLPVVNGTDARICFKTFKVENSEFKLPSSLSSENIKVEEVILLSKSEPLYPPSGYYCEGIMDKGTKDPVFPTNIEFTMDSKDRKGEIIGEYQIVFDKERKYGLYSKTDFNRIYKKTFLYDLSLGIEFQWTQSDKGAASSCELGGIDFSKGQASQFVTLMNMTTDQSHYKIRDEYIKFEYNPLKYQLFKEDDRTFRLNTDFGYKVVDIVFTYQKNSDSLVDKILMISDFFPNFKHKQIVEITSQNAPMDPFIEHSTRVCYENLSDNKLNAIIPLQLSFAVEQLSSAKDVNVYLRQHEIEEALFKDFFFIYWQDTISPDRIKVGSNVKVINKNNVIYSVDLLPKIDETLLYVQKNHKSYAGKKEPYTFKEGEEQTLERCIERCEYKLHSGEVECNGVEFTKISESDVGCNFILDSYFDPDTLPYSEYDFTVAYRPMRPPVEQRTSQNIISDLHQMANNSGTISSFVVNNTKTQKHELKLLLNTVQSEATAESINDVLASELNALSSSMKQTFTHVATFQELSEDSISLDLGHLHLQLCAESCLDARRGYGDCDMFDFHPLSGHCRLAKNDSSAKFNVASSRKVYFYTGLGNFDQPKEFTEVPVDSYLVAKDVEKTDCLSLCLENSVKGVEGKILVEFPRPDVCHTFIWGSNKNCYLLTSDSLNSASVQNNPKLVPLLSQNDTQYFTYKRDFGKEFSQGIAFGVTIIPSFWNYDSTGECDTACFTNLGHDCTAFAECKIEGDTAVHCYLFASNSTMGHYLEPTDPFSPGKQHRCISYYRSGRIPPAVYYEITETEVPITYMKTVGLVFLAIFLFILGIAIGVGIMFLLS